MCHNYRTKRDYVGTGATDCNPFSPDSGNLGEYTHLYAPKFVQSLTRQPSGLQEGGS